MKLLLVLFFAGISFGFHEISVNQHLKNTPENTYPTPPSTDKMLFYIQRSHNKNTIVYDLNLLADGTINPKEPVHPYWIRYEEGGVKKELSAIQRRFAYGLNFQLMDKQSGGYMLNFVSYKKRSVYLMKPGKDKPYKVYVYINDKIAELSKIFIKTESSTYWFAVVKYVEVFGRDLKTGAMLYEKINNSDEK